MVRFTYTRPSESKKHPYFPYYFEQWTSYDPDDTSKCTNKNWTDVWQHDSVRDRLHRKYSNYYSRETEDSDDFQQEAPTLAIFLFCAIIFSLFVPQVIDLIATVFLPIPLPPPSPPTPPPGPKSRKCLRLYHYATPSRKRHRKRGSGASVDTTEYSYDPENIINYVSATRIRTLEDYNGDADDETERSDDEHKILGRKRSK